VATGRRVNGVTNANRATGSALEKGDHFSSKSKILLQINKIVILFVLMKNIFLIKILILFCCLVEKMWCRK
jgi:hypothetical protein